MFHLFSINYELEIAGIRLIFVTSLAINSTCQKAFILLKYLPRLIIALIIKISR